MLPIITLLTKSNSNYDNTILKFDGKELGGTVCFSVPFPGSGLIVVVGGCVVVIVVVVVLHICSGCIDVSLVDGGCPVLLVDVSGCFIAPVVVEMVFLLLEVKLVSLQFSLIYPS